MQPSNTTLVSILQQHAQEQGDRRLYTFLANGDDESATRTFADADKRARAIASALSEYKLRRKTALLLFNDSAEFVDALLGCFYAGVIAVPAVVPKPNRPITSVAAIARDAGVSAVLSGSTERANLVEVLSPHLNSGLWLTTRDFDGHAASDHQREIRPDDTAFLQYTSGSTGSPKGVVVTHGNLVANEADTQYRMRLSKESTNVCWLPLFHDMGLIGNVLLPLYTGFGSVLMPPVTFLQKPLRWLTAISKYGGTISGGPNFAYELSVQRTSVDQRSQLDLSTWVVAYSGAEPVRASTIDRFVTAFASASFKRSSVYPCYGLAESTLFTTGVVQGTEPRVMSVSRQALGSGQIADPATPEDTMPLVSCGAGAPGVQLEIVDPDTHTRAGSKRIGEIWVKSSSVANGYHDKPELTEKYFRATLKDGGKDPFLRTGDLGFLSEGELFVTGRIKDVIIIRGINHYPQDIEASVEEASHLIRGGAVAAVGSDGDAGAALVVVAELTREGWNRTDLDQVVQDVRAAIANNHGLLVQDIAFIKPGSLPRTTSGKVRRSHCLTLYVARALETVASRHQPVEGMA